MSNPSIDADKTPWYQWDTGLTVTVSGGEMTECHFANRKQGTAYVQAVINGVARVPDELLQVAAPIKAYGYVSDGAGGQTYVEQTFEVIARNIPSDYTYTKTAQKTIRDAEAARDQAVQAAKDAKASELAADDSAVEASNSAQSAGESASAAATSASNAAKSAGDAAKSASDAKAAADKAVEDASDLLKTYTDNAKTSADNAATSASNAADAASAASDSASAAEQSATDASNAKVAAQTAKAEAEAAKGKADTSASNAAASATAAAKSASDAAASVGDINMIAPKHTSIPPSQENGIAIGSNAVSKGTWSVALGSFSYAEGAGATAIGSQSRATNNFSTAAVNGATTSRDREFSVGSPEHPSYVANVTTPSFGSDAPNKKYTDDNDAKTLNEAKKYTDDNDAKTLNEAKKYTDANTSNALVGTVSGKLLHVEDAWPGKPLGLTIDGAYKQDGTPSPENPVPIQVVEHPVVKVTGRNLLAITDYACAYNLPVGSDLKIGVSSPMDFDSVTGVFSLKKEILPWDNGHLFSTEPLTSGTYHVSFEMWSDTGSGAYTIYVTSADYIVDSTYKSQQSNVNDAFLVGRKCIVKNEEVTVKDNQRIGLLVIVNGMTDVTNEFYVEKPLVSVAAQDTYEPHVSTSTPFTLPAEHPYLAALPDGTHDEIVIDKDGNASLVAMVGKTETAATDGVNATVGTDALSSTGAIADGATVYYKLATPVTYTLGKLDIPALPETISNVWVDANLTTEMSMTYKRDINVAFENLVQAVVAAAAGE